jgi:glycine cleavage system pyridoxal-binding protein P
MERNILGGLDVCEKISNGMLLCVTEMNSQEDIDTLVSALGESK